MDMTPILKMDPLAAVETLCLCLCVMRVKVYPYPLCVSDCEGSDNPLHHEAPADHRNDGILSRGY